ncbi:HNH endonuclease signature motif containing protein [Dickeya zeae]|uniref:HNH endonuclease signature motif containing protein n=1 Tax=Dickeya zeae TaxID=204042 RepID=UPI00143FF5AF|nr:HNH endonuclease signature motif containing protein [Dickeya zeae]QIZ47714.1 HNH endonuclease [Dickeya zeae]
MSKNDRQVHIANVLGIRKGSRNSNKLFCTIRRYIDIDKTDTAIITAIKQSAEYKLWQRSNNNNSINHELPHHDINILKTEKINIKRKPQHIKDRVLIRPVGSNVDYEEFNSVHNAMITTGTGTPQDARQFRKVVKTVGKAVWPDDDPRKTAQTALDGKKWEMRLKHPRLANDELSDFVPTKRKGKRGSYGAISRPAQKSFSDAVRNNCFGQCVISGVRSKVRGEAAHLIEHCKDGVDHWSNGLWLRIDIHRLFDASQCAINPRTLKIYFAPSLLEDDKDLAEYDGKPIASTKKQIKVEYLQKRWAKFCELHETDQIKFD